MSQLPIAQDLIASQNAKLAGPLGDDYDALGHQLRRRGIDGPDAVPQQLVQHVAAISIPSHPSASASGFRIQKS